MATQHPISAAHDSGERVLSLTAYTGRLALRPKGVLGSFSIDDGNGSENGRFKMNFRFFNLCRVSDSHLLKMASVGEFPWS